MEFIELIKQRQSCRDFNDKPLEKHVVDEIVENARFAPSACNSQPWKIYVVTDDKMVEKVKPALQDRGRNPFISKAKAFICIAEKDAVLKPGTNVKYKSTHFVKYDIGELTAYITLTAKSLGVDSCIIGWINDNALKETIGYADNEICNIVVALGYSDAPLREKIRKDKEITVVEVK